MLQNQWFVVQTNPQREIFVGEQLAPLQPYLPRFKKPNGRIAALFPGYLFVPALPHWGAINATVGVRQVLMSGENPACISGRVIASWKAKERGGLVQLPPPPRFRVGERLTILRGSLRYRTVIYVGMSGRDRERVLIEMLGQNVSLIVPTVDLVADFRPPSGNRLRNRREAFMSQRTGRLSQAVM